MTALGYDLALIPPGGRVSISDAALPWVLGVGCVASSMLGALLALALAANRSGRADPLCVWPDGVCTCGEPEGHQGREDA